MQGFIVIDYFDQFPEFIEQMGTWIGGGKLNLKKQFTMASKMLLMHFLACSKVKIKEKCW